MLMSGRCVAFAVTFLIPVTLAGLLTRQVWNIQAGISDLFTLFVICSIRNGRELVLLSARQSTRRRQSDFNAILTLAAIGIICAAILTIGA
jgi:hypothetical protein